MGISRKLICIVAWVAAGTAYGEEPDRAACRQIAGNRTDHTSPFDMPYPLSLSFNLVQRLEAAIIAAGDYDGPARAWRFSQVPDAIASAQRKNGLEVTGCVTWQLIAIYLPEE